MGSVIHSRFNDQLFVSVAACLQCFAGVVSCPNLARNLNLRHISYKSENYNDACFGREGMGIHKNEVTLNRASFKLNNRITMLHSLQIN